MKVETFEVGGPLLIHGARHLDDRGYFVETYKESAYLELGLPRFIQDNLSVSKEGVFRGLHWQAPPMEQGKLVSCLHGEIVDYVVDIRRSSPSFGKHLAVNLAGSDDISFWVPPGFAHGFQSTRDNSIVAYKLTQHWSREHEHSMHPLDPAIGLDIAPGSVLLSKKDVNAPGLASHPGLFD